MASNPDILGKGWGFPFRFTTLGRVNQITSGTIDQAILKVRMSIQQILGTKVGSRVIDRDFGADLRGLIFTPIDDLSAARIRFSIMDAIQNYEKRVEILNIEVSLAKASLGVIEASIDFRIIATQVTGNLVYPFYLTAEMRVQGQINV
jgi:phage baseplate assembly protein W